MKIAVIGIGLIGGSLAKELKKQYPQATFLGIDHNAAHLETAIAQGTVDTVATLSDIDKADRVILSIPVKASVALLPQLLDRISENCLVWDVGSTKKSICEAVVSHPKREQFLAAHPIAGTENSGPQAAHLGLFDGKPQILCEAKKTRADLLDWAKKSFRQMGMYLRFMEPKEHDKHMAYVSHLSHISSFMLGKTVLEREDDEQNIFDLAGSGFESTVRLAKSSPEMWLSIFEDNKAPILDILTAYIDNLENFRKQLEEGAYTDLYNQLKNTNQLKTILNGIKPN
ncbi:MAG: prephenate dehydrogenase [Flavobacteriaceae bacterium]|nr:prephenate dehydrogenase [Flavobacteriaceae bacterium]